MLIALVLAAVTAASVEPHVRDAVLVLGAADVACTESGRDYADGAHVLQVVRSRARSRLLSQYDGTLWTALWAKHQHAHGCRWPMTLRHLELGLEFVRDELPVEPWAKKALWYCHLEPEGTCESYCAPGTCLALGTVVHTYYGRP